tara:strand:+ start:276 stop:494 length:219 start_codon:yes stop_codon:yes gene_type:complete
MTIEILGVYSKELACSELASAAEAVLDGHRSTVVKNIEEKWCAKYPGALFPTSACNDAILKEAARRWVASNT